MAILGRAQPLVHSLKGTPLGTFNPRLFDWTKFKFIYSSVPGATQLGWTQLGVFNTWYLGGYMQPQMSSLRVFRNVINFAASLTPTAVLNRSMKISTTVFNASLTFSGSVLTHAGRLIDKLFFSGRLGRTESNLGSMMPGINTSYIIGATTQPSASTHFFRSAINFLANLNFTGAVSKNTNLARNAFAASLNFSGGITRNFGFLRTNFTAALSFTGAVLVSPFFKVFDKTLYLQKRLWTILTQSRFGLDYFPDPLTSSWGTFIWGSGYWGGPPPSVPVGSKWGSFHWGRAGNTWGAHLTQPVYTTIRVAKRVFNLINGVSQ